MFQIGSNIADIGDMMANIANKYFKFIADKINNDVQIFLTSLDD